MPTDRRTFIKRLALASVAAPFSLRLAAAQMPGQGAQHGPGMGHGPGMQHGPMAAGAAGGVGPDVLPPAAIPWDTGTCAFCGMTIATPPDASVGPGFRERTYGQVRLAQAEAAGEGAYHYESLGCLFNHAYVLGLTDGHGATFYVANLADPPATADELLLGRAAVFLWAENLSVSMRARLGAFPDAEAAAGHLHGHPELGRAHLHREDELMDLAPLPIGNLVPLLVRHLGL